MYLCVYYIEIRISSELPIGSSSGPEMNLKIGRWEFPPKLTGIWTQKIKRPPDTRSSSLIKPNINDEGLQQVSPFADSLFHQDSRREGACCYYRYGCEEGPDHSYSAPFG